ncbi:glycosyltransferase family 4 protein [Humibacillus xanthopallidus]|uniref:Glycosyltransferase involved in cell wall biosynthesis n=1 Tax=Humibacillus xanthopallidus TaxID=412689 RepID=A0A543I068_9MICO|nr:glycosyltransferase family 4 protein [Humibacillus xanthopallidus]TQM63988.1 glycosyltransferase involved in cell wall biosynthesis [Humibacillus xanthopallidus]
MRVLHAVRSDAFAGVESHVARLACAQVAAGDEVVVIGGDPDRMAAAVEGAARLVPARTVAEVVRAVRHWQRGADIVHAHMTAAEIACATALLGSSTPLVVTRHFARVRGSNPASTLAATAAATRVSAQMAISDYVARSIGGVSTVIHPGVLSTASTIPASERRPVVLVAQRLEAEKETEVAMTAFARSGLAGRGWRLELAGGGAERERLEALAGRLGIAPSTDFLGHRGDVTQLMRRASVLLAPCRVEGLGLTVLEAMAEALPVVAVAAGGHLETVGSVPGAALHPAGDADAAGSLLAELARDPAARDAYGAALQRAQRERFTPEHQALETAAVYREVI